MKYEGACCDRRPQRRLSSGGQGRTKSEARIKIIERARRECADESADVCRPSSCVVAMTGARQTDSESLVAAKAGGCWTQASQAAVGPRGTNAD
jgi:hypothetical protein